MRKSYKTSKQTIFTTLKCLKKLTFKKWVTRKNG